jgi:hypothetical protein
VVAVISFFVGLLMINLAIVSVVFRFLETVWASFDVSVVLGIAQLGITVVVACKLFSQKSWVDAFGALFAKTMMEKRDSF